MIGKLLGAVLLLALAAYLLVIGLTFIGAGKVVSVHKGDRSITIAHPDSTRTRVQVSKATFRACPVGALWLPLIEGRGLCFTPGKGE